MQKRADFFRLVLVALASSAITLLAFLGAGIPTAQQKQYTGNENHVITAEQAVKLVGNFKNNPSAPKIKGAYFGGNIFEKLLGQPGAVGIRYYYAKKDDGTDALVMVGVDSLGNDLVSGLYSDNGIPCPPFCGIQNSLNK